MKGRGFGAGLALLASVAVHLVFALGVALLNASGALGRFGENGELGGGGEEVSFEIAAVPAQVSAAPGRPATDPSAVRASPPAVEEQADPRSQMVVVENASQATAPEPKEPVEDPPVEETNPRPARETPEEQVAETNADDATPTETEPTESDEVEESADLSAWVLRQAGDDDADDSGRSLGDPEGEAEDAIAAAAGRGDLGRAASALAPEGSLCSDPVAGTWVASKYKATVGGGRWVRFTLFVERDGATLSGRILSRIWDGGPSDRRPPRDAEGECRAFNADSTWMMAARGSFQGNAVSFTAESARLIRQDCPGNGGYAPDRFTGNVSPEEDRLRVRNNDGAYEFDEPYTFRRTACD